MEKKKSLLQTAIEKRINKNKEVLKTKISNQMYWWLSVKRPFFIGDEYAINLVMLDRKAGTAKILVTNLKNMTSNEVELPTEESTNDSSSTK
jgi:hypothetical protein